MGMQTAQVQPSTRTDGKGFGNPTPDSQKVTYMGQTAQPQMGMPNQYSNTVGPWDNQQQQQQQQPSSAPVGKADGQNLSKMLGKGA